MSKILKKVFFTAFFTTIAAVNIFSQTTEQKNGFNFFPDEYSILDDNPVNGNNSDAVVNTTLERARKQYLQALSFIKKNDTKQAAKHFENAIEILNKLVSYPGIEIDEEFTDLAQSIIDDYESFIQNIDDLDENSSFFVIRDKLFQEIEKYNGSVKIKSIEVPADTLPKTGAIPKEFAHITIPLDDNEAVQRNLSFLQNTKTGQRFIYDCLTRKSKWFPMMLKIAKEEDLPPEIVFLSMIESRLSPNAVSRASAVGLWQFIRSTGKLYGLNDNSSMWIDERRDPEKSTRAAMRHLKDLYIELGHWHLALAAYNCGVGRVRKVLANADIENPTYWDIRKSLPRETRQYVPFFIATAKFSLNPEFYGFDPDIIQPEEEYLYDTVTIYEPANFEAIAKCVNATEDEIRELNPELIKHCTPPDAKSYTLKIPIGKKDAFVDNFSKMTPEEKMPWIFHIVQRGENLSKIAKKYNVSSREIASLNGLKSYKSRINKNDILRIPIEPSALSAYNTSNGDEENQKNDEIHSSKPPAIETKSKTITHIVKKGENLYKIAQLYGVRLADIRNYNNIPYDTDNISIGDELIIAVSEGNEQGGEPEISKIKKPSIIKHKVKRGETLAQIADEYGTTIENIQKSNRLKRNKIYIGQILKIYSTEDVAAKRLSDNGRKSKITHKVRKGETISTIAGRYSVSESELKKWNPNSIDGNTVYYGTNLTIYTNYAAKGGYASTTKKINKPPKYYKIRHGDTLGKIAQKFGVSVASLKSKNKNVNEKRLVVGQRIRIQ